MLNLIPQDIFCLYPIYLFRLFIIQFVNLFFCNLVFNIYKRERKS